jgi:hypothetical protein
MGEKDESLLPATEAPRAAAVVFEQLLTLREATDLGGVPTENIGLVELEIPRIEI